MTASPTGEARQRSETREWARVASGGGCHRKGNVRLFGDVRLLRFKAPRDVRRELPFYPNETPLKAFRLGRTAWALVRQHGELEERQLPVASEANARVRVRLALVRALQAPVIFFRGLFLKRQKFEHFLLLGYNCELAYRFLKANGFLDSTFFAWSCVWSCNDLLNALRRFDGLFAGEMTFDPTASDMFVDAATGVATHSRYDPRAGGGGGSRSTADIESEKAEVRSRMAHLREKFYRQLRDDAPTLAVRKMRTSECPEGDRRARELVRQLKEMGGRNFRLLVICQKADAGHFPAEHPDYLLRTVSSYNPEWRAATEQFGDRLGWMLIWREFAPAKRLVQHKTYKFEERRP